MPHSDLVKVDVMVAGLGLAGACLALQCRRRGRRVMVFDLPAANRASRVAAGLFNPITGKRLVKTWKADALFPYLKKFYADVERSMGRRFFYPMPLYIPFRSVGEQNMWAERHTEPDLAPYIRRVHTRPYDTARVYNPLGGIQLSRCGYIDTRVFINLVRALLAQDRLYREERLDEERLRITPQGVRYGDVQARKIVFCTGIHALTGRYFGGLTLRPLKGEIAHIETTYSLERRIYDRGVYAIGTGTSRCTVGSTYELNATAPGVTAKGQAVLIEKTGKLLKTPFKVVGQDWGIRPTTVDRRPLLGVHRTFDNLFIFNGLGTKGVSLAPWFSLQLARFLDGEEALDKEVDVARVALRLRSGSR